MCHKINNVRIINYAFCHKLHSIYGYNQTLHHNQYKIAYLLLVMNQDSLQFHFKEGSQFLIFIASVGIIVSENSYHQILPPYSTTNTLEYDVERLSHQKIFYISGIVPQEQIETSQEHNFKEITLFQVGIQKNHLNSITKIDSFYFLSSIKQIYN